jgi:hypothetical protein
LNVPLAPLKAIRADRRSLYFLDIGQGHYEWPPYAVCSYLKVQFELTELTMSDLLYLAGGVAVFLVFAGYALLLKRA